MTRKEWRHLVVFYKNHEYVPDFACKYKERLIALHYQRPDYMSTMKFTRRLKWYSIYEAIVTNTINHELHFPVINHKPNIS